MSEAKHSIQKKMARLDELLEWFASEDFDLEVALDRFAEAKKLADTITDELMTVKNNITIVNEQFTKDKE